MNKKIIFNHIPKTAGSTFLSILENEYGKTQMFHVNSMNPHKSIEDFFKLTNIEVDNLKCIAGHLTDKLIDKLNEDFIEVVFLREPKEALISEFYYIKRASWNKHHENVKKMNSIIEYINYRKELNMENQQTRYLANETEHLLKSLTPEKKVDADSYNKALDKLKKIDYVLLTENFDESILLLHNQLNWKKKPYYKIANKTNNRLSISELNNRELEEILEFNKFDIKLYEFAKEIFIDNLFSQNNKFRLKVKRFSLINKTISKFL